MTLYRDFHYLLNLNEVLILAFSVDLIFIIKEAESMHVIRNNRDFYFLIYKGDAVAYWKPLNTPLKYSRPTIHT